MDAASMLTKEEAMAAAGDLWDEAKWEAAEKDGEGKVTAEALLAFAPAPAPAPAAAASTIVAKVQAALDAMAAKEPELNACVEQLGESALKLAAEADAKAGEAAAAAARPLEGVPILVKANIDLAGTLSTNATPALKDVRPASTATVVAKLLEAGAIPIAKTT
jgi:Asp-tRNA(Asn)/Glu-tRNA(Gln) amidotransferase A subunit family amidase